MKSKLFLGIILIIAILSSMLITVTEGVCNYEDGGGISGNQGGSSNPLAVGTKGAPVTNRTKDSCNEATLIENGSRLKEAEGKLNELKKIAANVGQGITETNKKGILNNLRMSKEMASAAGDGEGSDENPACEKYPEAC